MPKAKHMGIVGCSADGTMVGSVPVCETII